MTLFLETHCEFRSKDEKIELREGLHVVMQCTCDNIFADRYWLLEHPGGGAAWRETHDEGIYTRINLVLRTRTCVQRERSEDAITSKRIRT